MNQTVMSTIRAAIKRWEDNRGRPRYRINSSDRQEIAEMVVQDVEAAGYRILSAGVARQFFSAFVESAIAKLATEAASCPCTSEDLHCDCTGLTRAIEVLRELS